MALMDIGSVLDWERPKDMDSDEMAFLLAVALQYEGRPYRYEFKSDGESFVSVECVPKPEGRP